MANCDNKLAVNITGDACNPATKGIKSLGYLANFDDIDPSKMVKEDNSNHYKAIALKEGAKLYKIYQLGKNPFNGALSEAQVSDFRTTWNKTLPFLIFENGSDVTHNIVDKIANGKYVAVVENAYAGKGGDNTFEILGLEQGLTLTEGNNEKYNEDYGGGWSLTLQEQNAPTSALYVFDTDVATTRQHLEDMCDAAQLPTE